jgi:hypothetical protein
LAVDGSIVDLIRIEFPDETPIIDRRLPKPVAPTGGEAWSASPPQRRDDTK